MRTSITDQVELGIRKMEKDIHHLIAMLDYFIEATGESLDPEDAANLAAIRKNYGTGK